MARIFRLQVLLAIPARLVVLLIRQEVSSAGIAVDPLLYSNALDGNRGRQVPRHPYVPVVVQVYNRVGSFAASAVACFRAPGGNKWLVLCRPSVALFAQRLLTGGRIPALGVIPGWIGANSIALCIFRLFVKKKGDNIAIIDNIVLSFNF
jgi:hypothetical protein